MRIEDRKLDTETGELSVIGIVVAFVLLVIVGGVFARDHESQCAVTKPVHVLGMDVALSTDCPKEGAHGKAAR